MSGTSGGNKKRQRSDGMNKIIKVRTKNNKIRKLTSILTKNPTCINTVNALKRWRAQ